MKIQLNKFVSEVSSLLSSRIAALGISIISSIILARLLGPEAKGVVTTLLVIPGLVMSFADLGLRQATAYFMGKKLYDDQSIISTVSLLYVLTSIGGVLFVFILYGIGGYFHSYDSLIVFLPLALIPIKLIGTYANGVLLAKKQINQISVSTILTETVYLLFVILLAIIPAEWRVAGALIAESLAALATTVYILAVIRKFGQLTIRYIPGLPWIFIQKGVVYAIALFILGLNYRLDIIILERLSNSYEVGVYSIGVGLADMLWLLPNALTTAIFSRSANSTDAYDHAQKTARVLRLSLWLGIIPTIALYILSPWLIPLIYGSAYATSGYVVQAILIGTYLAMIFKVLYSDLAGRGVPQAGLWVLGVATIINIILNIWLDPIYGSIGAAWASTFSYTIGAVLFTIVYARMSRVNYRDLFMIKKTDLHGIIKL